MVFDQDERPSIHTLLDLCRCSPSGKACKGLRHDSGACVVEACLSVHSTAKKGDTVHKLNSEAE